MKYRAEIDGLRAIAVLPVILFHAGFDLFKGGYVGVDVFFVISGYLITTILLEDLEKNRFSLMNFYERRARRILPALYFMILISVIIGWFILTPYFYRDLFQTIFANSLFNSNYLIYLKSGYFARVAELKPLLHTWSLSVEEQYYLVFPLLLMLIWHLGRIITLYFFILILISSFLFGHVGFIDANANFLVLPSRAWELLAGSIVAMLLQKKNFPGNNFLATLGLIAIIFSVFNSKIGTPFPSYHSIIPVIGTMVVIVFANSETIIGKILKIKIIVGLGLISYSLYLWHQPVFSFLKHLLFSEPTFLQSFIAMLIILFLSIFSWYYIERPFRDKKRFKKKIIIKYSIFVLVLSSLIGLLGHYKLGFTNRLSIETQIISEGAFDKSPKQFPCNYIYDLKDTGNSCLIGAKNKVNPSILLIGDSHADHLTQALHNKLLLKKMSAYNFSFKDCSPVEFKGNKLDFVSNDCFEKIVKFIKNNKNIDTVIVSFRWVTRLPGIGYGNFAEAYTKDKILDEKVLKNRGQILANKLENLIDPNIKLILIYPVPEAGEDVPNYTVKKRILVDENYTLEVPYSSFIERNKYAYYALDLVSSPKEIIRIYPSDTLCGKESGFCKTVLDGKSLYYDDDHLSNFGASLIIKDIF